jgi:hypothetical protein
LNSSSIFSRSIHTRIPKPPYLTDDKQYEVVTFTKRLKKLEEKAAKESILYTENQLAAL